MYVIPVVGCVLRSHFRWLDPRSEAFEESVSCCVTKLFTLFLSDKFYEKFYVDERTQFSYLYQICKFEVVSVLNRLNRDKQLGIPVPPALLNLDTSEAGIWYRVFLKEIPAEVYRKASECIRFKGEEFEMCQFILTSLIEGRGVPVVLIRTRWGSSNLKFFVGYIRVLIRMALVSLKEEIAMIPSVLDVEEARLYESAAQGMYDDDLTVSDELDFWFGVDKIPEEA